MAIRPVGNPDEPTPAAFQELSIYYGVSPLKAQQMLDAGLTITEIQEHARTLNGYGQAPLQ